MKLANLIFCIAFVISPLSHDACCDDRESLEKRRQRVLAEMKANREKLVRGVYEANGKMLYGGADVGELRIFCAFDYEKNLLRNDRSEPSGRGRYGLQYARTPEMITVSVDGNSIVSIRKPGHKGYRPKPIDLRTLGLACRGDIGQRTSLDSLLKSFQKHFTHPRFMKEGDLLHVVWHRKEERWIDTSRDFWPIRAVQKTADRTGDTIKYVESGRTDMKLTRVNSLWVPSWFRVVQNGTGFELTLKWKSVNEPIPDDTFTYEGFDLSGKKWVTDHRPDDPVRIRDLERKSAKSP